MAKKASSEEITIQRMNQETVAFKIRGTSPYVQHKFSKKAKDRDWET